MKYDIQRTSQFKKDYKLAKKIGLELDKLKKVISILADGKELPAEYLNHHLAGNYKGCMECHIEPD